VAGKSTARKPASAPQPLGLPSLDFSIIDYAPFPMAAVEGTSHVLRYVNPAFCHLLDKPSGQLVGLPFGKILPETDECVTWLDRVFRSGKPESHLELEHSKPRPGFWSFALWPLWAGERPVGVMIQVTETAQSQEKTLAMNEALVLGALRQHELNEAADLLNLELAKEIAERKRAEERAQLLMKELAHRGQNQLAVLQSIASQSLAGARPLAEAREVLMQRLYALGRSQSVLMKEDFVGVPLSVIVRLEFEAFLDHRVKAGGPDVMLQPKMAQIFALIVHELATNASKHGALSAATGAIDIRWSIEGAGAEAMFKFQWQERDGPPVIPPTRQGFGRTLLERAVATEFGVPSKIRFAPEGLSYEIEAPLSAVVAEVSGGGTRALEGSADMTWIGGRVR
jgi:two-component sensor histidine kinase